MCAMGGEVVYEIVDGCIAVVTLDRPHKLNAIDAAMGEGLADAARRSDGDPDVRAVILTASGGRAFCVGADISDGTAPRRVGVASFVHETRRKPWIAAVRGLAVAGGLELCLACDVIVAGDDAQLGLPEVKRSLIAGAGGLTLLPRAIPQHVALEMIATGEPITAERAHALGLVNRVVPAGQVLDAALAIARRIAANAPIAVQESLAVARRAAELDAAASRAATEEAAARVRAAEDVQEGLRSFLEKRAPVWKGR
jgi:enoyl-CoA hydratase/carnithine racemase